MLIDTFGTVDEILGIDGFAALKFEETFACAGTACNWDALADDFDGCVALRRDWAGDGELAAFCRDETGVIVVFDGSGTCCWKDFGICCCCCC